jgi:ABC-type transport system involved in cytochrome c biogenesis permease component
VRSALATYGVDSGSFFLGKSLAVATELFVVSATLATVGSILWHFSACAALASVVPLVVMVLSLSLAGTLYGALAGSQSSVTLAAVVSLPAYAPILLCGSSWIRGIMLGSSVGHWAVMSCVITLVYGALGTLLYGVVEEI